MKNEKTIESYLTENYEKKIIDHSLRVMIDNRGEVTFYIHPTGQNGDTLDFHVLGRTLLLRGEYHTSAFWSDDPILNPRHDSDVERARRDTLHGVNG